MIEVRFHGRGGQGVVSGAELLSIAAFLQGKHAQAFPSFGSERRGAPVVSYCRIDEKPIRLREPVLRPDVLVIQDPTLLGIVDVFSGLAPGGYVLVNSAHALEDLGIGETLARLPPGHACAVPATDLAVKYVKQPRPNAALLGAVAALTGIVTIESVEAALQRKFPPKVVGPNAQAARAAYEAALSRPGE